MEVTAKERAIKLRDSKGWNVIPLNYFKRNLLNGKKDAPLGTPWKSYQKINFDIEKNWREHHKAVAIMTGVTSNITIVDIDSEEKAVAYETTLKRSLSDMCNYVVKTFKGYQLYYTYNKNLTTKIMGAEKTDILSGGLTFADPFNDSYTMFHDAGEDLEPMPQDLLDIILEKLAARQDNNFDDALSQAIREDSDLAYRNPMLFTIRDFLTSKIIGKKLNEDLKAIFYSKSYEFMLHDKKFTKFSSCVIDGERHNQLVYFGSLVAASPTVDKKLYKQFMEKLHKQIFKLDIDEDLHEANLFKNRVDGNMKYWRYDEDWQTKYETVNTDDYIKYIKRYEIEIWKDSTQTKSYRIYDPFEKQDIGKNSINELKDYVVWLYRRFENIEDVNLLDKDIVTNIKGCIDESRLIERRNAFEVSQDGRFFANEQGNARFNLFYRSGYLLDILEDNTHLKLKIPPTIKIILDNVFPIKEEQARFLHDLTYHMKNLNATTVGYVIVGAQGSGKNRIADSLLKPLYSGVMGKDAYYHQDTATSFTSRFKDQFKNKLCINLDEVKNQTPFNGGDLGSFYNTLKTVLANESSTIESKGMGKETVSNNAFYLITSNDPRPFVLEDDDDRRLIFIKTKSVKLDSIDGYPEDIEEARLLIENELPDFVKYLTTIKLDSVKTKQIIYNDARAFMFKASETRGSNIFKSIKANDPEMCDTEEVAELLRIMYSDKCSNISISDLKNACGSEPYKELYGKLTEAGYEKVRDSKLGRCWKLNPNNLGLRLEEMFEEIEDDDIFK